MKIAVLTLEGYNELDSFVAAAILGRMRGAGWSAAITSPSERVTSMNGLTVERQQPMSFVREADAVIIGSGIYTRDYAADPAFLAQLELGPERQVIAAQCSGTLLLAKLGLLGSVPACTDLTTKPWVQDAGVDVIDAPFIAHGNIATAGGCMASVYLAAWVMGRLGGEDAVRDALHYVAPVGEKAPYVNHTLSVVRPFWDPQSAA